MDISTKKFRGRLRRISVDEAEQMKLVLKEREKLPLDLRAEVDVPESVNESIEAAFLWSMGVLWQDHQSFVILGGLCSLFSLGIKVYEIAQSIVH